MSIELAEKLQKEKEALTEIVASMDEQLNAYKDLGFLACKQGLIM